MFWFHRTSTASMRAFLLHIACGEGSALLTRLTSTCSLAPLYKDAGCNLRPIPFGCVWRKAWAKDVPLQVALSDC